MTFPWYLRGCLLGVALPLLEMQTALFLFTIFPPPTSRTLGLTGLHGTRTGRATDAEKATRMQRADGNRVLLCIGPRLFPGHGQQGMEFVQPVRRIPLDAGQALPVGRMVATDAGDPHVRPAQGPAKRLDLANVATGQALLDGIIEPVGALLGKQRLRSLGVGEIGLDRDLIKAARTRLQLVGFLEQPAGIQRHHAHRQVIGCYRMKDHLVFQAETGREDGAFELVSKDAQGCREGQLREAFSKTSGVGGDRVDWPWYLGEVRGQRPPLRGELAARSR